MAQQKKVKLYTLSTCAVCHQVERFFEEHGIAYEQIVVDELDSGEQWLVSKELKKHNPQATYPTVVVEEVIKGFDEERLKEALAIK